METRRAQRARSQRYGTAQRAFFRLLRPLFAPTYTTTTMTGNTTKLDAEEIKAMVRKRQEEKRQQREWDERMFLLCLSETFADICSEEERNDVLQALCVAWEWGKEN